MAGRGVHFALSEEDVQALRNEVGDKQRLFHVSNVIEATFFEHFKERVVESDKAWDAIHRVMSGGELTWEGGEYPLDHVVLGGERLYEGDDYIMILKTPSQVRDAAVALPAIDEKEFTRRYLAIAPDYERPLDEEDLNFAWDWSRHLVAFWFLAAEENRYVLFTCDL